MPKTLVMKFGGTSMGSEAAIRQTISIIQTAHTREAWPRVAVVVSAMSGVTDALLAGAQAAARGDEALVAQIVTQLRSRHLETLQALAPDVQEVQAKILTYVDEFAALCHAIGILGEASPRALDAIASLGEPKWTSSPWTNMRPSSGGCMP